MKVALSTLFCLGTVGMSHGQDITEHIMAGYIPASDVRDHSFIDLDVALIASLLKEERIEDASKVYAEGAFSRSYAEVAFGDGGLPSDIPGHSPVTGVTNDGGAIKAMTLNQGKQGDKVLRLLYDNHASELKCNVGGNPEPVYDGCFAASGEIRFDTLDTTVPYEYDQHTNNKNDRILALLSLHAKGTMRPCPRCEYWNEFSRFFNFYGKTDYAHRFITTAFTGARTVFDSSAVDFESFELDARAAAVNKAIVTMSTAMYVIREMEIAVIECKKDCSSGDCSSTKSLESSDAAAAMYIGSLEGKDGKGDGKLMYSIADIECKEFKTCGIKNDRTKGTSKVNIEIIRGFQDMQTNLTARACPAARAHKDVITNWMKVPLIQGTLRHAWNRARNMDVTNVDIAEGAAYAASIVPLVAACSFKDAEIIGDNLETTAPTTDFTMVKEAFERHYACLGLKCKDIGGYWDNDGDEYFEGAEPCTFDVPEEELAEDKKTLGWAIGVPLFVIAAVLILIRRRNSRSKRKRRADGDDDSDSSEDEDDLII